MKTPMSLTLIALLFGLLESAIAAPATQLGATNLPATATASNRTVRTPRLTALPSARPSNDGYPSDFIGPRPPASLSSSSPVTTPAPANQPVVASSGPVIAPSPAASPTRTNAPASPSTTPAVTAAPNTATTPAPSPSPVIPAIPSPAPASPAPVATTAPAGPPAFPTLPVPSPLGQNRPLPTPAGPRPFPPVAAATNAANAANAANATNATNTANAAAVPAGTAAAPPTTPAGAESESTVEAVNFKAMPLDQFLMEIYGEVAARTVLRPSSLPDVKITLITKTPLTKKELLQAFDAVLALNQITMIPVGDKFVEAVPQTQALMEGAALSKINPKDLPESSRFVTQIVQLTNALPSEVLPSLQPFAKIQGGVVAIDSSQTIVLRDYAPNVKRMMEVIEKVDVVTPTDYKLEVIPIKYGKVEDIYVVMSDLISSGGGRGGATGAVGARPGAVGASRTGRNRNSRTSSNRTGTGLRSLGSSGAPGAYGQAGQPNVLGQANQPTAAGQQPSFRDRLAQIVRSATGSGAEDLLANARIIPDDRSNSLVVYATRDDMMVLTNMVAKLDVLLAQVLIDAIIVDVNLDKSLNFGISAAGSKTAGKWDHASLLNNGQGFLSSVTNFPGSLPTGFSYFGKYNGNFDVAVQALATDNSANILQRPRIQTTHAVPATFINGKTVPYITGTSSYGYGYGPTTSYAQLTVGIELSVTPYITPDDLVVMEISQSIDDIAGYTTIDNNQVPITTTRSAEATVSVHNGDTILLGGFIRQEKTNNKSGVPVLKDLPLLGALFRSTAKTGNRSELMVFLRPTVLNNPQEAANLATTERKSLPGVSATEKMFKLEDEKQLEQSKGKSGRK